MNKWNNKFRYQVASCWLFILSEYIHFYSPYVMMQGLTLQHFSCADFHNEVHVI